MRKKTYKCYLVVTPSAFFLARLVLVIVNFLSVMDEIQKVLDGLEKSVRSLQDQMDSMKRASEVPVSGAKSPEKSSPSASRGDEVPSWRTEWSSRLRP